MTPAGRHGTRCGVDFVWREGVHVVESGLWCDAPRAHDLCFLSSAQAFLTSERSAWQRSALLCSEKTWRFCQALDGRAQARSLLLSPTGRPFQLGTLRLELFASGGVSGASSLWLRLPSGRTVAYAGAPNPRADFSRAAGGEPMQVRSAETLVCNAPLASLAQSLPSLEEAAARLRDLIAEGQAAATVSVLLCPPLTMARPIVEILGSTGLHAHPQILRAVHASQLLDPSSSTLPKLVRHARALRGGQVLLWPLSTVNELPRLAQLLHADAGGARFFLCSGLGLLPEVAAACRAALDAIGHELSAILPFPDVMDRQGLIDYVAATEARQLYLTTGFSETLASLLRRDRKRVAVSPLGPPSQLVLLP